MKGVILNKRLDFGDRNDVTPDKQILFYAERNG
jgi:hypothetical protein